MLKIWGGVLFANLPPLPTIALAAKEIFDKIFTEFFLTNYQNMIAKCVQNTSGAPVANKIVDNRGHKYFLKKEVRSHVLK